ncbi:MAG: hypothetical protein ACRC46_05775 [Thermoguttaceae bacterium]
MRNVCNIYDIELEAYGLCQRDWLTAGSSVAWDYNADDADDERDDRMNRHEANEWRDLSWSAYDAEGEYVPRSKRK